MKRKLTLFLSVIMAFTVVCLGACGQKKTDEITIVASNTTKVYMDKVVKAYNDKTDGLKVKPLYNANQDGYINANKAPDLIFTNNLDAENKYYYVLEDLSPYIERDKFDTGDYYGDIVGNMTNDKGELRGIPVTCNMSLLYYNKKMFDAHNEGKNKSEKLEYPNENWTLDDFSDACEKLTITSGAGTVQYGAELTTSWWSEWLIYVRSYGGDIMNEEESDIILDSDEAKKGFLYMYDLFKSGHATRIANSFVGGTAAMLMGGHTGNWLSYNAIDDFDWDVAPLPTVKMGERLATSEITADVYGIAKTSKNKEDAWKFLKFLTGYEGQHIISQYVSTVSCLKSIGNEILKTPYKDRKNPKNLEAIYEVQLEYVKPLPTYQHYRTLHDNYVGPYIVKLFEGNYSGSNIEQVKAMLAESMTRARDYMANPN